MMSEIPLPLLETRLQPPRLLAGLVDRTGLLARLDAFSAFKLTLIVSPAGSGKSTLINQWFVQRDTLEQQKVAWVLLDASDNNLLRFWRMVMTACQKLLSPSRRAEVQAALATITHSSSIPFSSPSLQTALIQLLNALSDPVAGGWLILDDYHVINDALIHETMTFFIDHLPTNVQVIMLSRAKPTLPLVRWRARGEIAELHGIDLRFSRDETAAFFNKAFSHTVSEKALLQVEQTLEGWVAGLRLLVLTLDSWRNAAAIEHALLSLGTQINRSRQDLDMVNDPQRSLFDYFVSEILDTQEDAMQRFLLCTSILDSHCVSLCDAVLQRQDSLLRLEEAIQNGLFLEVIEGAGGWFRYHALFTEAMRREAIRRIGEMEVKNCALRASFWYEQEMLLMEAIEAAWIAQDLERVATLIELTYEQNFNDPQTLLRWLELLPETVLQTHPLLCFLFANEICFPIQLWYAQDVVSAETHREVSVKERARIEVLLQMAEHGWKRCGEQSWIGGIWAHRALSALMDQEPLSTIVYFAQQALNKLSAKEGLDGRLQMYRSSCLYFVSREKVIQGQITDAQQMLGQALVDNVSPGNRFLAADIHLWLGKVLLIQEKFQLAEQYLRQALTDAHELSDEKVYIDALIDLSGLALERHDLVNAMQQAHEALELVEQLTSGNQELHDRAIVQFAWLRLAQTETKLQTYEADALQRLIVLQNHPQMECTSDSRWLLSRLPTVQSLVLGKDGSFGEMWKKTGMVNTLPYEQLTTHEERVLQLIMSGWNNQEIAQRLVVSVNTVKYHIKHIYQKLGVSNRLQASEAARHLFQSPHSSTKNTSDVTSHQKKLPRK